MKETRLENKLPFRFFESFEEADAKMSTIPNNVIPYFCIAEMPRNAWFQDETSHRLYKIIRYDNKSEDMLCMCGDTGKTVHIDASDNAYYIGAKKTKTLKQF